jgi:transposase
LDFVGVKLPENHQLKHWSRKFIDYLLALNFKQELTKLALEKLISNLIQVRAELSDIIKLQRKAVKKHDNIQKTIEHLQSIPGIGFITAITLYTEILDIGRFSKFDKLCSYVGLIPAVSSSGEKERTLGISNQQNTYLRNMLIESSWVAVRKDSAMTMTFGNLTQRMSKQKAIIRIAKKMLSRIKYVWQNQTDYTYSVIE